MLPLALALFVSFSHLTPVRSELPPNPTVVVAEFRTVGTCEEMTKPETLNSPTPMLKNLSVAKLDFIVGYDGRVYSTLLLVSNGTSTSDHMVLKVVNTWRFRPATCNRVPVDAEGQVIFIKQ